MAAKLSKKLQSHKTVFGSLWSKPLQQVKGVGLKFIFYDFVQLVYHGIIGLYKCVNIYTELLLKVF